MQAPVWREDLDVFLLSWPQSKVKEVKCTPRWPVSIKPLQVHDVDKRRLDGNGYSPASPHIRFQKSGVAAWIGKY
jgi:hypothetical protein